MNEAFRQTQPESLIGSDTEVGLDRTLADVVRAEWPNRAPVTLPDADLDDLRLEAEIGRGGMGVVFRAVQLSLNRPVAVKLLDPHRGWSAEQLERFHQEVLMAASVSHPNVAHVHWVRRQGAFFYFVMELIDGPSLAELLSRRPLAPDEIVGLMTQVCDGLQNAHDKGVVHRDLKPGNILIEPAASGDGSGRAVLVDFGLAARHGETSTTSAGQLMGTPAYMSPEQAAGRPTDHRSDIYSLGVTLFEALTGRVPFSAPTPVAMAMRHLCAPPPDPRTVVPHIATSFADLTNALLLKEPAERPQSASTVRAMLLEALEHERRSTPVRTTISGIPGLEQRAAIALAVQLEGFLGAATDQPLTRTTFVLESWMDLVEDAVTQAGGLLVKQEAALLVAVFPEPRHATTPQLAALEALRALIAAVRNFNRTHGRQEAFTAGLERGELVVGTLGAEARPIGFGRAIDTAVALSAVRHCGVGIIGPQLTDHLDESVPFEPLIGVAEELGSAARIDPAYLRG